MRVKNITQRFEGFVQDLQESFWGRFPGADAAKAEGAAGERRRTANGRVLRAEVARAGRAGRACGLSEWLLRTGLRDPVGSDSTAHSAHAAALVSAVLHRATSPPVAGSGRTDPAGILAGDFDAPGGTRGGGAHGRAGQCADRLAADAHSGPSGGSLSPSPARR